MSSASLTSVPMQCRSNEQQGQLLLRLDDLFIPGKVLGQTADIAGWRSSSLRCPLGDGRDIVIGSFGNVAEIAKVERRLRRVDRRHFLRLRPKELLLQEGNACFEIGILFVERENDPG